MARKDVASGRRVARLLVTAAVALLLAVMSAPPCRQGMAAPPDGATVISADEANAAAGRWLQLILEQDGQWAGSATPSLGPIGELRRGDMTVAYYVPVRPRGFIILSILRDFAPIMAYSTKSDLNPEEEGGMTGLLKDVGQARVEFTLRKFGSLEAARLAEIDPSTSALNRQVWSRLLTLDVDRLAGLDSILPLSAGEAGPLLRTNWHQRPPYNNQCPNLGCPWPDYGNYNQNAWVGCVPLGMAQIMRYFAWPPRYMGQPYQWTNMLESYVWNKWNRRFEDQNGVPVTQAQIDAVADLCADVGSTLDIDYGCDGTGAHMCNWYYDDARDAFEDHFLYSDPEHDEPWCEERDSYDFATWWAMIVEEVDHNRPMLYRIADTDFDHLIVVDGYRDTRGHYEVHANYGWVDDNYDAWYTLDQFYCNGPCDWGKYEMVRMIYPRTGWCNYASGTFGPASVPSYVYCDVTLNNVTMNGGTWLQFLPGKKITCGAATFVNIYGNDNPGTRFYSEGVSSRGLKVSSGGKITLHPNGSIKVY